MPGFHYLILWKNYPEEENTWEPILVDIYLRKLINTFHKEYSEKSTASFLLLDSALSMARLLVLKKLKQKHGHLSKRTNKRGRNEDIKLKLLMNRVFFMAPDLDVMLKPLI